MSRDLLRFETPYAALCLGLATLAAMIAALALASGGCIGYTPGCPLPKPTASPAMDRKMLFAPAPRNFALTSATGADVVAVPGAVQKICKLTGEMDWEAYNEAPNRTESRAGLIGTDLGISFPHHGKLFFLFGDTSPVSSSTHPWLNDDSIAVSVGGTPENCMNLQFLTQGTRDYRPIVIPGVSGSTFEVPTGGFSLNDHMYMFYSTDHSEAKVMGRSVLARSDDEGVSWKKAAEVSNDKFINVAAWPLPAGGGDAASAALGPGVLLFGSGTYRATPVYLAFAPASSVEDPSTWRFLSGTIGGGGGNGGANGAATQPLWANGEQAASAITDESCVGELSVAWNPFLQRWIMLYNCYDANWGIHMKTAQQPWGPWSASQTIFNGTRDQGICHFMHRGWKLNPEFDPSSACDCIGDPDQEAESGAEYGPYMIPSLFTGADGYSTIYFVISTHNPYNTVLMKALIGFP